MKTIGKLKLNQLSKASLKARELNILKGGYCVCDDGCYCSSCDSMTDNHQFSGDYNSLYMSTNASDQVDVGGDNLGYNPSNPGFPPLY